ncbi:MAG: T9SS type A sorting domain-containing protein, partial [Bacteroidota bacterium]
EFYSTYGPAPNNAYLIDTTGIVFAKHAWFDKYPQDIFCDIDSLLGNPSNCNTAAAGTFQWQLTGSHWTFGSPGQTLYAYGQFINNSAQDVVIEMVKDPEIVPVDWATSICTDVCYPPNKDTASLLLPAGDTLLYTQYFYSGASPDTGRVRMRFTNVNNPQNMFLQPFIGVTSLATSVDAGIGEVEMVAVPNPFSASVTLRLPADWEVMHPAAEVQIYNVQGKMIARSWPGDSGEAVFETAGWVEGIYMYRVMENGRTIGVGKLLRY